MEQLIFLDDEKAIDDGTCERSEIYDNAKKEVRDFLEENYISSVEVLRGCVVDICRVLENLIPHDIRFSTPLYEAGTCSGERVGKWLVEQFSLEEKSLKEIVCYSDVFISEFGFGQVKFLKGKDYNILRAKGGTFFAKEYGYVGAPVCYYFSGFIAGATKLLSGIGVTVKEVRCIAAGDHHCEFVIRPKGGNGGSKISLIHA